MRTFFKTLLTGITSDKLARLPYLGYSILLMLLPLLFAFITVSAISTGESLLGGNLQQAQDQLRSWFSIPFVIVAVILVFALIYMSLNIMVKRIRDIGLPVILTIIALILIGVGSSWLFSPPSKIGGAINLIIFLALILIPSNTVRSKAAI